MFNILASVVDSKKNAMKRAGGGRKAKSSGNIDYTDGAALRGDDLLYKPFKL